MTTSFWDKNEVEKQFAECMTLKEIIRRIETDFSLRGEVICEIRVNGMILDEGDETKFAESPRQEIQDIAIRSNKPADLINDALASAHAFIPELEDSCLKTAEMFRGSNLQESQNSFNTCLEGCQWLVDTLMHVRGAASGVGQPIHQPERWFEAEKVIARVIREMSEAYSKKDYVLVADLLEYELTGALIVWKEALALERPLRKPNGSR